MTENERVDILRHCKWVDEIISPCPWIITLDFVNEHNIDFVAHDDKPYGSVGQDDIYAEIKAAGKFIATQRTEGISTSDIIFRVIQDYDTYVQQSLAKGYKRKEIGVSWTKLQRIKIKKYIRQTFGTRDFKKDEDKDDEDMDSRKGKGSSIIKIITSSVRKILGYKDVEPSDNEGDASDGPASEGE